MFGGANDLDGSPLNLFHSGQHEFARNFLQELILDGSALEGKFDFVFGANWYEQEARARNYSDQFIDCPACTGFFRLSQTSGTIFDNHALAGFGQSTLHVTEKLSLTGGIRFTTERKEAKYKLCSFDRTRSSTSLSGRDFLTCISLYNGFQNVPFLATHRQQLLDPRSVLGIFHERFHGWSPMARIQYQWTDDQQTYLTWARGYQSGGFNPRPGGSSATLLRLTSEAFEEEDLFSWEVGYKSQWLDNRLQLNVAGYYNEFKNQQITTFVPGGGTTTAVQNAGRSRIRGFEVEALTAPVDGLTIQVNHAWTNFDYAEFVGADPTDPTGQRQIDFAGTRDRGHLPKRKWAGYIQYEFPPMNFGTLLLT